MSTSSETPRGTVGRLFPLSGLVFVILVLLAIVVIGGNTPDSDATAAKVASFYGDHQSQQQIAAFVLSASLPFLVLFAAYLTLVLWPREAGRRPIWQIILAGGGVLTATAFAISAFIHFALADGGDTLAAGPLQTLNVLDSNTWVAFNPSLGVMMLGAAGSLIPRARAYRVMGWVALVIGLALFIPFADFFALLLTGIWLIVISIMLFRSEPAPA